MATPPTPTRALLGGAAGRLVRRRRSLQGPYRRLAGRLFEAIATTDHAEYVVDSSHFPLRARELQRAPGLELCLVFLVRDPQAVVPSIGRLDGHRGGARRLLTDLRTTPSCGSPTALAGGLQAQPPERRVFVRYEDLVERPEAVLRAILDRAGPSAELPDLAHLRTGLAFHANRLIDSEEVALGRRGRGAPAHRSAVTRVLQWPWSRVFARLESEDGPAAPARS